MRVVLAGATGFIGKALESYLQSQGHETVSLSRHPKPGEVGWDARSVGPWSEELSRADGLINLTGSPINARWTKANREKILASRIESTRALANGLANQQQTPFTWINASATGFYGPHGDEPVTEATPSGTGFLAEVCKAWEDAALAPPLQGVTRKIVRIGVVIGKDGRSGKPGGALKVLVPLTRAGLGGNLGNGNQHLPWIALADLVRLFEFALTTQTPTILNGCALESPTNREFMRALRKVLGVPLGMPAPGFALRAAQSLIGFPAETVLDGARVVPEAALNSGFKFELAELSAALAHAL